MLGVKLRYLGGFGQLERGQDGLLSVRAERCATRPSMVAKVTRCMRSSSWRRLRQVWLLRTSDLTLTAENLAAAYKQLLAVERGWRDAKTSLGLLALLLIRVAETRTGRQHNWT